ncbi:MAG: adenosylmethionine decarboxylase [Candidatus Diapherotrites archaeon]|uniref:Adenosylmethionine decarboxylase n=1 Tax=Candidatus Iainarchaeum sp. TaxID=3101447 RepID=A0A2D6M202_9ARCH|nr:adenosylmethionine decarboxylase [Candidatus Diapherotrites archaeon]
MIFFYLLAFLDGLLTKMTDNFVDEPFKSKHPVLPYLTGITYGLLAGFLITISTEFATIIIAITIGVLIAGKIDSREHQFAVAALFIFASLFGFPAINFPFLVIFLLLGFLDEILNDFIDKIKEKDKSVNRLVEKVVSVRLSLEIGAIAIGFVTGNFEYFFLLFAFDLAYNLIDKAMPLFLEKFSADYGPQLALDLYKCNAKKLGDKKFVEKILNEFPAKIGMQKISEAHIIEYKAPKKEDSGLSGFVIIAESHITIHTYPLQGFAKIDVVSCKRFDHEKATEILKKAFNASEAEAKVLYRGKHYPSEIKKAKQLVEKERSTL